MKIIVYATFALFLLAFTQVKNNEKIASVGSHLKTCQKLAENEAVDLLFKYDIEAEAERLTKAGEAVFFVDTRMIFSYPGIAKVDARSIDNSKLKHIVPNCLSEHSNKDVGDTWFNGVGKFAVRFNQAMYFAQVRTGNATPEISLEDARGILDIGKDDWEKIKSKDKYQIHQLIVRLASTEKENDRFFENQTKTSGAKNENDAIKTESKQPE